MYFRKALIVGSCQIGLFLKRKVRQFGAFNIDVTDELRKSMAQRAQPMT